MSDPYLVSDPFDLTTWVTRDGRHILVKEMTTDHLQATVRMLKRNYEVQRDFAHMALAGAGFDEDSDAMFYSSRDLENIKPSPFLQVMQDELKSRGKGEEGL